MPNRSKKFYLNLNINSTWRLKNKCMEKKNENRMIEYFIMDEKFSISELVLKKIKKKSTKRILLDIDINYFIIYKLD